MNPKLSYYFGTCGWSYADWNKTVYPEKKPKYFNHLFFLSNLFEFVEVNTTFYHIPALKLVSGWVDKTRMCPGFQFWIKLYKNFTHERKVRAEEITAFKKSILPLYKSSQLSGLLIQFPYSFKMSSSNFLYLEELYNYFAEYCLAVEFRHKSWINDELLEMFHSYGIVFVNIDQPVISLSLPLTSRVTNPDISYIRLHGRNHRNWFSDKGRDQRYHYDYNASELNDLKDNAIKIGKKAKKVFIAGNNHYKGNAVKNLLSLKKLL